MSQVSLTLFFSLTVTLSFTYAEIKPNEETRANVLERFELFINTSAVNATVVALDGRQITYYYHPLSVEPEGFSQDTAYQICNIKLPRNEVENKTTDSHVVMLLNATSEHLANTTQPIPSFKVVIFWHWLSSCHQGTIDRVRFVRLYFCEPDKSVNEKTALKVNCVDEVSCGYSTENGCATGEGCDRGAHWYCLKYGDSVNRNNNVWFFIVGIFVLLCLCNSKKECNVDCEEDTNTSSGHQPSTTIPSGNQPGAIEPDAPTSNGLSSHRREEITTGQLQTNLTVVDDDLPPPTYEEAMKMQS